MAQCILPSHIKVAVISIILYQSPNLIFLIKFRRARQRMSLIVNGADFSDIKICTSLQPMAPYCGNRSA